LTIVDWGDSGFWIGDGRFVIVDAPLDFPSLIFEFRSSICDMRFSNAALVFPIESITSRKNMFPLALTAISSNVYFQ
jgi:hypothetical protein